MKLLKTSSLALLLLLLFSASGFSATKSKNYSDFYHKYKGQEECVSMNIPGALFQLFMRNNDHKELTDDITNIKLLILENVSNPTNKIKTEVNEFLPPSLYKDLMIIRDGADKIVLKFREISADKNELIVLISDEDSILTLSISGNIDQKDAQKLIKSIDLDELKKDPPQDKN